MSLFTKQMMWRCAVNTMWTEFPYMEDKQAIVLRTPEDVEELYNALQKKHEKVIEDYERRMMK